MNMFLINVTMKNIKYIPLLLSIIILSSCGGEEQEFDANGHFETTEIKVYAENPGRLVFFSPETGSMLEKGQLIGLVDTTSIYLKKEQASAQIKAALAKIPGIRAQKNVVAKEIGGLEFEKSRISKLVKDGAATQKQLDDLNHAIDIAYARLETFDSQVQSVRAEKNVIETQLSLYNDQISRSAIKAPITGLVLEKYIQESELVSPGRILFSMASVTNMELKAYISGVQLSQVEIGQIVKVRIDWTNEEYREYSGTITWISDEAEFTPKIIQTKEERVNLVYAFKIQVKNDGKIKIGMPGEVIF